MQCTEMSYYCFVHVDPMVSFSMASFSTDEDMNTAVCAELSNVLSPGGTAQQINVTLNAMNDTAGMKGKFHLLLCTHALCIIFNFSIWK